MFDLRSKRRRFVALLSAAATTVSGLAFLPISAQAAGADTDSCTTNSYCVAVFSTVTTNGTWTVPANVNDLDILVVGGGGGGTRGRCGYAWGAGGGGGGVAEVLNLVVTPSANATVKVGSGGTGSGQCDTTTQGTNGGQSSIEISSNSISVLANGGVSPFTGTAMTSAPGGASGSKVINGTSTNGNAGGTVTFDNSGNCTYYNCNAGGGGGAGAAGNAKNAGTGVVSALTGTRFGGGGAGRAGNDWGTADSNAGRSTTCTASANSGAGGADCGSYAGNGGSGYVYLRYLPGPTSTTNGNQSVTVGQSATFGVTPTKATNLTTATFTYQWQKSTDGGTTWANISGATSATYSTATLNDTSGNGAKFRAKITQTGTTGTVSPTSFNYSAPATLSVSEVHTVTYDFNGATAGATPTSADFTTGGSALTLPSPTKTGYAFSGWFSDAGLTTSVGSAGASYSPTADLTLYAGWQLDNKTVIFNSNGGSGTMSSQVTNLAANLTANTFTRIGYTFNGWATAADGSGTQYADQASYPFTSNTTLYAQWTAIPNKTLTFDANDGSGTPATSTQAANVATNLTSNTFTRTGYTFAGWNTAPNGSGTAYADQASYPFAANGTLYAQWTAINRGITYSSGSHTSGSVPTDSGTYIIGNTVAILGNSGSLARTGYTFAGWTVAADGSGTVLVSGSTLTMGSANITVYAKWTANTYTITYNANGATGSPANASDSYTTAGTAVTLSAVGTMVKAGHTFAGWATTANGTPIAGTYTTASNVTLYAQWTINTITVTYDKGIASAATFTFPSAADSGNYGTRLNLSNNVASSVVINGTYYAFVGWSDGTTTFASGASYLLQSNVTMTAVWVQAFEVRYSFNGGTAANGSSEVDAECTLVNGSSLLCTDGQQITLNAQPTRTGYNFAGWRDQSGADFSAGASRALALTSYLFYAQWTPISYTVSYAGNGGTTSNTQANQNIGDRFTVGANANRTGYDFAGWSDGSNTYAAGATYVVGSSNVTLTAQWTPQTYTVVYDWNGGSGSSISNGSYTVGNAGITLPGTTDQVKDGYTFGGWASSIGGIALSSPFVPTASTTLFAIWGSGSYVITYAPELGTVAATTVTVANGSSINLETPTRQGFVFDGWFTAQTGGTRVGGANAQFTPAASRTLHARWTQASIYGIPVGNLSRLGSANASSSSNATFIGSNANSSVSVTVPSGALPSGTSVNVDLISDSSHASGLINGDKTFILSVAVSWLASDGTVPDTASGKSISVTLTNPDIKAGAAIYSVQGVTAVLLGTATQDGTVTFQLTQDPGIYVVATSPTAPLNPTSSVTSNSATISWQAPSSDGGDAITGYTVTLNNNSTCTTTGALSCSISGLSAGTTYTYTVSATNSVGTSPTAGGNFSIASNQTVIFDNNGGSGSMSNQVANVSTALTANTFSRTGYSFTGWNTAANGSGTAYADGATYAFTSGATLYAQWSGSTYTVTYDYNSATVQNGPASSGFTSGGTPITLPSPTKNGYSFDGWFTDSGLTTLLGAGGFTYSPTASGTLYAGFTALPNQTVVFDANGGTGTMANQVANFATILTSNAFTQTGYNFAGWNTASNGGGTAYANGASFPFTAGATLYAQWTLIPVAPPAPPAPLYERPDAPSGVSAKAVAGDSIVVSWTPPTFTGGTPIVDYGVTSSTGMACITTATSCTFNGVNKDVAYSFTVTSNNGYRVSNPSAASNTILIPSELINQRALSASGSQSTRGAAVKIVVSGGSTGGALIYDVENGTATGCSVDGEGWLTATTSGTCLVTVTMLGDFTYKPASTSTTLTFLCKLIAQEPLTVSASGATNALLTTSGGSGSGAVSYLVTGGTTSCVLAGTTITVAKTGTCVVTATKAADDVYEAASSIPITISVTAPKPVVVVPTPVVKVSPIKHVVTVAPSGKPVLVGIQIIKPVIFGPDSAKLDAGDLKQLRAAATLAKSKNMGVLVTGFVKSAGKSTLIEKLLASSRAKNVATYLRKLGVNVAIQYAGFGAYNKLAPSSNDRRVEIRWVAND